MNMCEVYNIHLAAQEQRVDGSIVMALPMINTSGFRSLWTIPHLCMYWMASTHCFMISQASRSQNPPNSDTLSSKCPPSASSVTRNTCSLVSNTSLSCKTPLWSLHLLSVSTSDSKYLISYIYMKGKEMNAAVVSVILSCVIVNVNVCPV